jgi:biotin synthase
MKNFNPIPLPQKVRVSIGSAVILGLLQGRLNAKPTTAYLLTYRQEKCSANCSFCPQAKTSTGRIDALSRVIWPPFLTKDVLSKIETSFKEGTIKRVCIQVLNYPDVFNDLVTLVNGIRSLEKVPVSVCCQPLNKRKMLQLVEVGVDRISIPLDTATKNLFNRIKGPLAGGPYVWEKQRNVLKEAVQIFGKGFVTTHLIVGLGEREKEIVKILQWCVDLGVYPSLFSFTPVPGTNLENHPQPSLSHYRRIQIAHYLITRSTTRGEKMIFDEDGRLIDFGISKKQLRQVVKSGMPFLTSGCPSCNRPYYNERPGGPLYNYPEKPLVVRDMPRIWKDMKKLVENTN